MDHILYNSMNNFKIEKFPEDAAFEYIIIQEKLDGCNFRLIFNHNEQQINFGSRTCLLIDQDFHGFYRIKDSLIEKVKKFSNLAHMKDKSFVIFGELVGFSQTGKRLQPRFVYDLDEKNVKGVHFFPYDVLIKKEESESETEAEALCEYEDFLKVQDWLKECDFNVIPYQVMNREEYSYDKLLQFKSILFHHENYQRMEGYVLRIKFKDFDGYKMLKLKPENLPGFEQIKTTRSEKGDTAKQPKDKIADGKFLDFISKWPFLDDDLKLKENCIDECIGEYKKETGACTKKDFIELFKSMSCYSRKKLNFQELHDKFMSVKV